jgi:hypothetical protein
MRVSTVRFSFAALTAALLFAWVPAASANPVTSKNISQFGTFAFDNANIKGSPLPAVSPEGPLKAMSPPSSLMEKPAFIGHPMISQVQREQHYPGKSHPQLGHFTHLCQKAKDLGHFRRTAIDYGR